ncbi:Subtilisin-like protein [Lachancea thermotolerans]
MRLFMAALFGLRAAGAVRFVAELGDTASVEEVLGEQYAATVAGGGVGAITLGNSFRAIYGEFPQQLLEDFYRSGQIVAMSMDRPLGVAEYMVQQHAPNHLARLSQKSSLRGGNGSDNGAYIYHSNAGNGVDVYLLDTGIDGTHPAFEGRVQKAADFSSDPVATGDPHGHGTAVAGVIGSSVFGVAKKCNLFDVRVANSTGHASLIGVLRALEHASKLAAVTKRPSLITIPLEMPRNTILNSAVEAVVRDLSIPVVVAAGNENRSACSVSPAGAYGALTIGSIDVARNDALAPFTNFAECVDLFTAGVDVATVGLDHSSEHHLSGTSISAGVASGLVAYYMSIGHYGMDAVNKIKLLSLPNVIPNLQQRSPETRNAILQNL